MYFLISGSIGLAVDEGRQIRTIFEEKSLLRSRVPGRMVQDWEKKVRRKGKKAWSFMKKGKGTMLGTARLRG